MKSRFVTRHAALLVGLVATGCLSEDSRTGTLVIPVQTRASDGALYRLTGEFHISDYELGANIVIDSTAKSEPIEIELAEGLWVVTSNPNAERVESSSDETGTWQVVEAAQPPRGNEAPFTYIKSHRSSTFAFKFIVQTASGEFVVTFDAR